MSSTMQELAGCKVNSGRQLAGRDLLAPSLVYTTNRTCLKLVPYESISDHDAEHLKCLMLNMTSAVKHEPCMLLSSRDWHCIVLHWGAS